MDACLPTLGAKAGLVALVTEDLSALDVVEIAGQRGLSVFVGDRLPLESRFPFAEVARNARVVVHELTPSGTALGIPLLLADRVLGSMSLTFEASRAFSEADAVLMLAIGREAAQALIRAELQAAERTARAATQAAEAVNQLRSDFLASMSHELRTPLNGIIGFTELLHDERIGPLDGRQKACTKHILNSSRPLLQVINDLLALTGIEEREPNEPPRKGAS